MAIVLATALILGIVLGCVALAVGANILTEIYARRLTAAELVRSAEALLRSSAAHHSL